jgi:hypothetical protein
MAQNSLKMYLSFQVAIDGNKQNVGNNSGGMVSDPLLISNCGHC